MKKSVKYGLYFVVGLVAVLCWQVLSIFSSCFRPLTGSWKVYIVMPWMYLCIYGYYRLTKRYTDWWCEWEKNN